tara:strand:+ start:354 stop:518 length:165 start_codon:yes stop_codon:yes gene_type:complete
VHSTRCPWSGEKKRRKEKEKKKKKKKETEETEENVRGRNKDHGGQTKNIKKSNA